MTLEVGASQETTGIFGLWMSEVPFVYLLRCDPSQFVDKRLYLTVHGIEPLMAAVGPLAYLEVNEIVRSLVVVFRGVVPLQFVGYYFYESVLQILSILLSWHLLCSGM